MKTHKGVSLTEYGLMAGTISLIVVPALFLLGQKLSQYTSEMLYYEKTPLIASSNSVIEASKTSDNELSKTNTITLYVQFTPQQLNQTIATMGANGSTEILANAIVKSAEQQLSAGSITETHIIS